MIDRLKRGSLIDLHALGTVALKEHLLVPARCVVLLFVECSWTGRGGKRSVGMWSLLARCVACSFCGLRSVSGMNMMIVSHLSTLFINFHRGAFDLLVIPLFIQAYEVFPHPFEVLFIFHLYDSLLAFYSSLSMSYRFLLRLSLFPFCSFSVFYFFISALIYSSSVRLVLILFSQLAPFSYIFLTSPLTSSPGSCSFAAGLPGSLVGFPPTYFVEQYIAQESTCRDVRCFIALQKPPGRLLISYNHHSRDTPAGAWRK